LARRPAALVGKFAKHKLDSGLEAGLGDKLKPDMATIITIVESVVCLHEHGEEGRVRPEAARDRGWSGPAPAPSP